MGVIEMAAPRGVPQVRLDLYRIDEETQRLSRKFWYALGLQFDSVTQKFYNRLQADPDTAHFISGGPMVERLRAAQKAHWQNLFTGKLDGDYVARVTSVAEAHLRIRLPNYHYMAAYAFFLNELTAQGLRLFAGDMDEAAQIVTSINKLVMFDMDLTMSIYMQRMVRRGVEAASNSAAKVASPA